MGWEGENMDCGSIIDLVGLVIAVPGVVLALLQWKKGNDFIKVSGRSKYKCFLLLPKDYGV